MANLRICFWRGTEAHRHLSGDRSLPLAVVEQFSRKRLHYEWLG